MKILIAEDDNVARSILAAYLRQWGHQIIETTNGAEALDYAIHSRCDIDIVITDWVMPKIDGVELSKKIRAISSESHYVYIMMLTGHGEIGDIEYGFSEGEVDDYITKPFAERELRQRIGVAERLIQAERRLRLYNQSLEAVVERQTEAIRATQAEIIHRLFSTIQSKEEKPAHHLRRIGIMSAHLGSLLGWSAEKIHAIRIAAPLHDVGKIGIPDQLTQKKAPLSREEFMIIQRHTTIGANILSHSQNPIIQMAETIAKYHHENWDGSGYPQGLHGNNIADVARVVSIIEAFEALMEDKPYRKAVSLDDALAIIKDEQGKKFDPDIAQVFLDNISDIVRHYENTKKEVDVVDIETFLI